MSGFERDVTHHIPDDLLLAYVSGSLSYPFSLVVAAHLSICDTCRAAAQAHSHIGGVMLDQHAPQAMSATARDRLFARLDEPAPAPVKASGPYPAPVVEAMGRTSPKWRRLGFGSRQAILSHGESGSVRLLYIPGGQAVPDHTHGGLELTLVLQGAFEDETGRYGVGDVEVANDDLDHTPVALPGQSCICLAATDAPLRFNSWMPRLLQPILRI